MPPKVQESTIEGISTAVARKVGKRIFKDHFDRIIQNGDFFETYVFESANRDVLDDFQENWPEFKIMLVATAEYKNQPPSRK